MTHNITKEPVIRFNGYNDAWEQSKLGEMYDIMSGFAFKLSDYTETGVPIVNGESINHGNVSSNNWNYLPENFRIEYDNFLLKKNDIVLGLNRPITNGYLKIAQIPITLDKSLLYQRAGKVEIINKTDLNFSYQLLSREIYKFVLKEAQGSDQPFISTTKLKKWSYFVPKNEDEQSKIGIFFKQLDETITLQERELELLKEQKQGFLQNMFPKSNEKEPKIRFKRFTDEWLTIKLKEIMLPTSESNKLGKYDQDDILAASLGSELEKKNIFFGLRSTKESVKKYRVVNVGDIIYTKSPIKGYPNGLIRTSKGNVGIVPSLYCVYKPIKNLNPNIIQCYFDDVYRLNSYLYPLVNVGARNNVNITDSGFLEGEICIPTQLEEQNRIVEFFENLNVIINLQERKLEALKSIKKSLLQKMFV